MGLGGAQRAGTNSNFEVSPAAVAACLPWNLSEKGGQDELCKTQTDHYSQAKEDNFKTEAQTRCSKDAGGGG